MPDFPFGFVLAQCIGIVMKRVRKFIIAVLASVLILSVLCSCVQNDSNPEESGSSSDSAEAGQTIGSLLSALKSGGYDMKYDYTKRDEFTTYKLTDASNANNVLIIAEYETNQQRSENTVRYPDGISSGKWSLYYGDTIAVSGETLETCADSFRELLFTLCGETAPEESE